MTRGIGFMLLVAAAFAAGCGGDRSMRLNSSPNLGSFVRDRTGGAPSADLDALRFRPGLCDGEDLRPDYAQLDENSLIRFLERQRIDVRIEKPRADLVYLNLASLPTDGPVRLRVAILKSADEAGRDLNQAILQHGPGAWGVHRSNLAVLGPAGDRSDDLAFAGMSKLACWGVFTIAGTDDTFVVPGAYSEL